MTNITLDREFLMKADPALKKFFNNVREDGILYKAPEENLLFEYPGHPDGPASGMRVLGIAGDNEGCGNFRIKYPLMVLASQGAKVEVRLMSIHAPLPLSSLFGADYILIQRAHDTQGPEIFDMLKKQRGTTWLYDIDDALQVVPANSPAAQYYNLKSRGGAEILTGINRYLAEADGALFSTRELAAFYGKKTKRHHIQLNGLDCNLGDRDWGINSPRFDWKSVAEAQGCTVNSDSLLFGYSAGKTHYQDMKLWGNAISRILQENKNAFFGIQVLPDIAYNLCVKTWNLPLDRVVYLSPVPFKEYPKSLTAFDLAICPLENTLFNQAKSCLRLLEFGAQAVPYVASPVAPFQRFHMESGGKFGKIARTEDQWVRHTTEYLQNHELRQETARGIQEFVRTHHDAHVTYASFHYTLKSTRMAALGRINTEPIIYLSDRLNGIPKMTGQIHKNMPCLCGSGKKYRLCVCNPAWGRV